jgi:hypothetical protein
LESRNIRLESRLNEGNAHRRQEVESQSGKTTEAYNADTIKDVLAVNEDHVYLVYSAYAALDIFLDPYVRECCICCLSARNRWGLVSTVVLVVSAMFIPI